MTSDSESATVRRTVGNSTPILSQNSKNFFFRYLYNRDYTTIVMKMVVMMVMVKKLMMMILMKMIINIKSIIKKLFLFTIINHIYSLMKFEIKHFSYFILQNFCPQLASVILFSLKI